MKISDPGPDLLRAATDGDLVSIDALLATIQPGVFNLAVRMLGNRDDAADATQEVLLKVVTHLAGFRGESAFATWVWRIARNQLLTAITRSKESPEVSLESIAERLQAGLDFATQLGGPAGALPPMLTPEDKLEARQIALGCTQNMLMALDREQRLVYVIDTLFDLSSAEAAEVVGISAEAYRQRLSRAHARLDAFAGATCGLVGADAACRCEKQLPALRHVRTAGRGGPPGLIALHPAERAEAERRFASFVRVGDAAALFRGHPDYRAPEAMRAAIRAVLGQEGFLETKGPAAAVSDAASATPRLIELAAADGTPLSALRYEPAAPPAADVLVAGALGVPQRFYAGFASWLARRGCRVMTFDLRGIGDSRLPRHRASLRGLHANMLTWAEQDFGAAVAALAALSPTGRIVVVGHSLGTHHAAMTTADVQARIERVVSVAAGTGYWRDWAPPSRRKAPLMLHLAGPLLVAALGWFPGRRLGMVGDLPGPAMRQWSRWCRDPGFALGVEPERLRPRFEAARFAIEALSFSDDEAMTEACTRKLLAALPNAPSRLQVVSPAAMGMAAIGHLGAFRRDAAATLWPLIEGLALSRSVSLS